MTEEVVDIDECLPDFVLYDEDNPRSLTNIVPAHINAAIRRVPRELLIMDELELEKKVLPSPTLNYLRLNFWLEYNRAQEMRKVMDFKLVIRGVAKMDYFSRVVLKNPLMLAWVLMPPADLTLVQRDILYSGLALMRKAMKIRLVTTKETITISKGGVETRKIVREPNVQGIAEVRKIVELLMDRVQGAVIQKVAIRSQSSGAPPPIAATYEPNAMEELQRLLSKTNDKLEAAAGLAPTVETIEGSVE